MALAEILLAISNGDADDNLDAVIDAARSRRETVSKIRAQALKPGDRVMLVNISPKALAGAVGTVVTPKRSGDKYVGLRLDPQSKQPIRVPAKFWTHVNDAVAADTLPVLRVHYATVQPIGA